MFKKSTLYIFFVLAISTSCSPHTQPKDVQDLQKKENARQQIIQMASKYNADFNWLTIVDGREFFTIELQQVLLEPPGKSYLLLAPIVDVIKQEDAYFITAHDLISNIYYQLRCNAQQAQYVIRSSGNDFRKFDEYAIVMKPESVIKPVAQLAGEIDADTAYVIHEASDISIVKGACLDILSIKNSQLNAGDFLPRNSAKQ